MQFTLELPSIFDDLLEFGGCSSILLSGFRQRKVVIITIGRIAWQLVHFSLFCACLFDRLRFFSSGCDILDRRCVPIILAQGLNIVQTWRIWLFQTLN